MHFAHIGSAVVLMGCIMDSEGREEHTQRMAINDRLDFHGNKITLTKVDQAGGPYYQIETATFLVENGYKKFTLQPEKRYYPLREIITSETAIKGTGLADLYSVLGPFQGNDSWIIKFYWHPFVKLLWLGAGILLFAGILAYVRALRTLRRMVN